MSTFPSPSAPSPYLDGQLLVAMPGMQDSRFARSVIYLCAHSGEGAMGIVVNRRAKKLRFDDLIGELELTPQGASIRASNKVRDVPVLKGGPVEGQRGFVLHSADFHIEESTLAVDDDISLTATVDVLRAIVEGTGPARAILALGYAGWSAGQLEEEIQNNGWLTCPADPDLLFDGDLDGKYVRALQKLGIDPAMLVSDSGHA